VARSALQRALCAAVARDPLALRKALYPVRAIITPPSVAIDAATLKAAPMLRAVGRLSAGAENIDVEACTRAASRSCAPPTPARPPRPNSRSLRCCSCCAACRW